MAWLAKFRKIDLNTTWAFMKRTLIGYGQFRTKKKKKRKKNVNQLQNIFRQNFALLGHALHPLTEEVLSWRILDGQLIGGYDVTSVRSLWIFICITVIFGVGWRRGRDRFQVPTTWPPAHPRDLSKRVSLKPPRPSTSIRLDRFIEKGDSSGLHE